MARDYYIREGYFCEKWGNVYIDAMLSNLIRFHSVTDVDRADIIAFCSNAVQHNQLGILLKHMGTYEPIKSSSVLVDSKIIGDDKIIFTQMDLKDVNLQWRRSGFVLTGFQIPLSTGEGMIGRPLSDLIEHPYLPGDALIRKFIIEGNNITVALAPTCE